MVEAPSETSLNELFTRVSIPWLEALGTPDTLRDIGRICREFALCNSPCLVFECPIDDDTASLDFSLELLSGGLGQLTAPPRQADAAAEDWDRIRSYSEEYARKDSLLSRHVAHTWLEYDTCVKADTDIPSLFMELDNSGAQRHRFSDDPDGSFNALCQGAEILCPSLSAATVNLLKQCALLLPGRSGVLGIGIMLARPVKALRFCANQVAVDELEDYLGELGWPGPLQTIPGTLPQLPGYESRCRLAFDVSETIGDSIGVEIVAQPPDRFREHDDWRIWLDTLVERNLCTPSKRDILTGWLGQSVHPVSDRYTPDRIFRDISHLKFTFDLHGKVRTKAYLHASLLSGESLQGWFLQQFEDLETGAPPPTYPGV